MMRRAAFDHDRLTLSYLDSGRDGPLIVALHAMWMEARTFEGFARAMPDWRVVSMVRQAACSLCDMAAC